MDVVEENPFMSLWFFGLVGGMCEGKLRLLKATSRSQPERTPIWMIGKELNCVFFFSPVQRNWSGVWQQLVVLLWAVTGRHIYNSKQTLALNFTEDQTSTHNRPIIAPDSSDTERQYLFYESRIHVFRSNKKHQNSRLTLHTCRFWTQGQNMAFGIFAYHCYCTCY